MLSSITAEEETIIPEKAKHPLLLVDDEPDILFSLKGLLRRDFELHTANNAQEAVEIMAQHPIHVVMTDQRMPQTTGVELLGNVRAQYPDAIRIVFTGYADIKAVVDAINTGGLFRYITKPWDPDELIEVLHQAAAKYDELLERKQLIADLRSFVAWTRELTSAGMSDESQQLQRQATSLLVRIDQSSIPPQPA